MRKVSILIWTVLLMGLFGGNAVWAEGFNDVGDNNTANLFNGNGYQWCERINYDSDWCNENILNIYGNDHIVSKTSDTWIVTHWVGRMPDASGQIWLYKIVWVDGVAIFITNKGKDDYYEGNLKELVSPNGLGYYK